MLAHKKNHPKSKNVSQILDEISKNNFPFSFELYMIRSETWAGPLQHQNLLCEIFSSPKLVGQMDGHSNPLFFGKGQFIFIWCLTLL